MSKQSGPAAAGRPNRPRGQAVDGTVRSELARMRQSLDRVESALAAQPDRDSAPPARSRPDRYFQLLLDVYERGRHGVDADALAALGRARSYDSRGLGGFFVGSRAPLRRTHDRVYLTVEGHRLLDSYLDADT